MTHELEEARKIHECVVIHEGVVIHKDVAIHEGVVIREGVAIHEEVEIHEDVEINEGAVICKGAVIREGVVIHAGAVIREGAVIRDGAEICKDTVIYAGAAIGVDRKNVSACMVIRGCNRWGITGQICDDGLIVTIGRMNDNRGLPMKEALDQILEKYPDESRLYYAAIALIGQWYEQQKG